MPYPPNVDPGIGILYFNVRDYGAVGDGVTDDADTIQNCINNSPVDAVIFFPPGTYIVGTAIQLMENRSYLGTNSSTIKMKDGADLVAVLASQSWIDNETASGNPIRIANLNINGNSDNNSSGHGIVLMNFNSMIRECTVDSCADNGIILSSINQSGTSISNTCTENRVESCKVSNCLGYGIYGRDTSGKLINAHIEDCIVSSTTLTAIRSEYSSNFFVMRNHCYDCQSSGITLANCFDTFVVNNKINGFGQDASGSGFESGIAMTMVGTAASVCLGNTIESSEPAAGIHYQYLSITFGGLTDTRCFVFGNQIEGGWNGNSNNPASPQFSQAIIYDANGTQTGGGQPAYLFASHNNHNNCGNGIFWDGYPTLATTEFAGDLQIDGHLVIDNFLLGAPALAALSHNGTSPPSPTFSAIGGSDTRGFVKFGSGGSPSSGDQISVTFSQAYPSNMPIIVATPQNAATAALGIYVSSASVTGFNIATQNAPTASQAGTVYDVAFIVIG